MSEERELASLVSSAKLVLVGGIVGAGAKFAERVIIGQYLSPTVYGEVSIGIAILTFSSTFALAGLSQGVPRFLSRYDDERDERGVWLTGLSLSLALAVLVAGALLLGSEFVVAVLFEEPESATLVALLALTVPFLVAQHVAVGAVRGHENTIYRTYTKDLLYPVGRIVVLVVLLSQGLGILAAGWAYLVAAAVTSLVTHWLLHRLVPLVGAVRLHVRELVTFSLPLVVSTVLNILLMRTDTLMLGYLRTSAEVGQYAAAYPIAGGMLVVITAFGYLYLPMASRLDANDERGALDNIYTITTKWVYVVTFPAFLTFVVFPVEVMHIFFGEAYTPAARVLPILALGFFLSVAVGRDRETLSALGDTTFIMYANAAGFLVNVVLNLLLIPRYSYVGAAVTSVLSFAAVHAVVTGVLWRRYGIVPLSPEAVRTMVALPVVLLPLAVLVSDVVTLTAATLLPFMLVVGLASVLTVALAGGLQPQDRVVLEFVEETVGGQVPLIRRYLPEE